VIVADVNLVAYLMITGEMTAQAWQVWRRDPDWRAPALWSYEFGNILTRYIRGGHLSLDTVLRLHRRATGRFGRSEIETRHRDVLRVAASYGIAALDAHYIVAAIALGVPCVTEDQALRKAVPRYTLSMAQFLARAT
jgi:predicted nucleic acid-binding protein